MDEPFTSLLVPVRTRVCLSLVALCLSGGEGACYPVMA